MEINLNQSSLFNNLGLVLRKWEKFEGAIQALHQAVLIKPDSAGIYCNLDNTLHEQRKLGWVSV
ncbi:TPA: tetratricopeptide repeat protein [Candidatus Poribacteria bacterium]|nr:tetratricopeptide repeat protein [Candidatus Poribacteria bacterium]HIB91555.1 tetratricopeptide repeat protein [Candidatus Poribacteria bacterium]HIC01979.1 tetratricopeptide repeat protein [Candidatus Poribacteria bacterium]HIN27597.1 tetratricopeptide repeat protein [Candidatus Poribacteria bacterium]HIO05866.1 tetratricopeptide repeat protein [Candidatus Poribacteria bacterium]